MKKDEAVTENSVVQINEKGPEGWNGCLLQVSEVRDYGIQGWVQTPVDRGRIWINLDWEQFDYIGQAALVPQKTL